MSEYASQSAATSTRPAITCVGSMMIDLIFYSADVPGEGETVFGDDFAQGFGGKGANQCVVASLLGADVAMIGALGDDGFGRETVQNFESFGIDASQVLLLEDSYSGVANIIVEPGGGNRIILGAGANLRLTPDHVEQAFGALPTPTVVLSQLEVPQEAIVAGFRLAKDAGAATVLTPAPAAPVSDELVAVTDWFVPNHHELAVLAGVDDPGEDHAQWVATAVRFAERSGAGVVLTMGADGAALVRPGAEPVHVTSPKVEAVDTTGAGDALCGSFAWALASGRDPEDALRLAVRLAADSVTRRGTQSSYAREDDLARLLADGN